MASFKRHTDHFRPVYPVIKRKFKEEQGAMYERILVPITDVEISLSDSHHKSENLQQRA